MRKIHIFRHLGAVIFLFSPGQTNWTKAWDTSGILCVRTPWVILQWQSSLQMHKTWLWSHINIACLLTDCSWLHMQCVKMPLAAGRDTCVIDVCYLAAGENKCTSAPGSSCLRFVQDSCGWPPEDRKESGKRYNKWEKVKKRKQTKESKEAKL